MHCIIKPDSLVFNINGKKITKKDIARIDIDHHFSYDDIRLKLIDGRIVRTTLENHSIDVFSRPSVLDAFVENPDSRQSPCFQIRLEYNSV